MGVVKGFSSREDATTNTITPNAVKRYQFYNVNLRALGSDEHKKMLNCFFYWQKIMLNCVDHPSHPHHGIYRSLPGTLKIHKIMNVTSFPAFLSFAITMIVKAVFT